MKENAVRRSQYITLPTIGKILKEEFLEPLSLSQNALAKAIGVPSNRIHAIINGTRSITADTDLRLAKFFGVSDGYFLGIQEDIEIRKTRRELENSLSKIIPYSKLYKEKVTHA